MSAVPVEVSDKPTNPIPGWLELPIRWRSAESVSGLPALVQCFCDALSRFGCVELSGIQVTAFVLESNEKSCVWDLVSVLNWFNTNLKARAEAIVAFDQGLLGSCKVSELVAALQYRNTGAFEFGTTSSMHEKYRVKVPAEMPFYQAVPQSDVGVFVSLPEWTPSAGGWLLASVVDIAQSIESYSSSFAIRVTRVR